MLFGALERRAAIQEATATQILMEIVKVEQQSSFVRFAAVAQPSPPL